MPRRLAGSIETEERSKIDEIDEINMKDLQNIRKHNQQVNKESVEELSFANSQCFVAGTLVHTINGLVPIEQIKVGDLVLSKPEQGGELAYKPVTQTFVRHEQQVVAVPLIIDSKFKTTEQGRQRASRMLVMTPKHPVKTVMDGWIKAGELGRDECVVLSNGNYARVKRSSGFVLQTKNPLHGLHSVEESIDCGWGQLIDFSRYPVVDFSRFNVDFDEFDDGYVPPEMLHTVYNFEVADYHTYFVGDLYEYDQSGQLVGDALGVWVHNSCCGDCNKD